jgi:hypothetical protein
MKKKRKKGKGDRSTCQLAWLCLLGTMSTQYSPAGGPFHSCAFFFAINYKKILEFYHLFPLLEIPHSTTDRQLFPPFHLGKLGLRVRETP